MANRTPKYERFNIHSRFVLQNCIIFTQPDHLSKVGWKKNLKKIWQFTIEAVEGGSHVIGRKMWGVDIYVSDLPACLLYCSTGVDIVYQYISIVYHICVRLYTACLLSARLKLFPQSLLIYVSDYVLPTCFLADIFLQSFFVPDFILHCCYITTLLPSFLFQEIRSTSTYFPFSW